MKKAMVLFISILLSILVASCATVPVTKKNKDDSFYGHFKMYSFKLYRGGLIQDNINRLGKLSGFHVHTVNLNPGCDVFTESYVIERWNIESIYQSIAGHDFEVTFHEVGTPNQMVVFKFIGDPSKLVGCYK
jgi:hypothetical protein